MAQRQPEVVVVAAADRRLLVLVGQVAAVLLRLQAQGLAALQTQAAAAAQGLLPQVLAVRAL
jgi:hypothetical protein